MTNKDDQDNNKYNAETPPYLPDEKMVVVATDFIKITNADTGEVITSKRG